MSTAVLDDLPAGTKRRKRVCDHCGSPLSESAASDNRFCCSGCAYVSRLVHEHGLDGYYRVKDEVTAPVDASVFQATDYSWLARAQQGAEKAAHLPELTVDLQGISCAGCVWLIERLFHQQAGARHIVVNAQYGTMELRWTREEFSVPEFAHKLRSFGYLVGPAGEKGQAPESNDLVRRIGLCAAFAMNVMLFTLPIYFGMERSFEWARLFSILSLVFATLSLLVGGSYFIGRAFRALGAGMMQIDLPIALGIAGAYLGSTYGWIVGQERFIYFDFVSTFILLMLVGRWAQVSAVERNRRRLLALQPRLPPVRIKTATGAIEEIGSEQLVLGSNFWVASGQTLPVDAELVASAAEFSLASMNGEAAPRLFRASQVVPSGAVYLGRNDVAFVARQAWKESLFAELSKPSAHAGHRHELLERVIRGYLVAIIGLAAAAGIAWWLHTHDAARTGSVVTAVLVVSCPCAIGLAFPLADEIATVALRRRGVFVRENDLWSKLARVREIVFDKTGTLTLETPELVQGRTIAELPSAARAALLAMVRNNAHPISRTLFESLLADGRGEFLSGEVGETVGFGVELDAWSLGRAGWRDNGGAGPETVLAQRGQVVARFTFVDSLRPGVAAEVAALQRAGFRVHILSGDNQEKVMRVAVALGLAAPHAFSNLSPQEKAEWFDEHAANNALMLGDGANDSLAFERSLCRGTPVIHRGMLEHKADFYYLGRGIDGIRTLFEVNRIRRRAQTTILLFSIGYNLVAVGLALAGKMDPLIAAALMPANSSLSLALVLGRMRRVVRPTG